MFEGKRERRAGPPPSRSPGSSLTTIFEQHVRESSDTASIIKMFRKFFFYVRKRFLELPSRRELVDLLDSLSSDFRSHPSLSLLLLPFSSVEPIEESKNKYVSVYSLSQFARIVYGIEKEGREEGRREMELAREGGSGYLRLVSSPPRDSTSLYRSNFLLHS
ncbi:hypothetical protein BDY24DRAFT_383332 [Mrakia frigida]|uniref:uncharacterized protein n=1 Tax=Mrakia frigida TaxID=29902 RepID=UPI003FCBEFA8